MYRGCYSQAVKWTLACDAGRICCLSHACRWAPGFLTIRPHRRHTEMCTGSQQKTRCLWHPRWSWVSRPALPISPDCCTCQEEYEGRAAQHTLCLLCLSTAGKLITHLPGWAQCGRCRLCKVQSCPHTLSTYLWANPCVHVEWMKAWQKPKW